MEKSPEHWPAEVGRHWLQAHRNLKDENWDASALMARSALQVALRDQKAKGSNLKQEIEDLAKKGVLPPLMVEWSHNVRELANDSAHPQPGQADQELSESEGGQGVGVDWLAFLMRTNRTRNGVVFNLGEFALTAFQPRSR